MKQKHMQLKHRKTNTKAYTAKTNIKLQNPGLSPSKTFSEETE